MVTDHDLMAMSGYEISRAIPIGYSRGYTIPTHFHVVLEHHRSCFGEASGLWVDQWHDRLRFSCFCLLWAAVGAQMSIDKIAIAD